MPVVGRYLTKAGVCILYEDWLGARLRVNYLNYRRVENWFED